MWYQILVIGLSLLIIIFNSIIYYRWKKFYKASIFCNQFMLKYLIAEIKLKLNNNSLSSTNRKIYLEIEKYLRTRWGRDWYIYLGGLKEVKRIIAKNK